MARVDFVHGGGGGQKSRGRRTLMPRACVRALEIRAGRLEKGDADGKRRSARGYSGGLG